MLNNYLLLQSIFVINRETKKIKDKLPIEKGKEYTLLLNEMNKLYVIKQKALNYVLYFFEHNIDVHNYNNDSYWLVQLSGFEFHFPYVKLPKANNKKIKVPHKAYETIKEICLSEAIGYVYIFLNNMKKDEKFQDFDRKLMYTIDNKIRPLIHY